MPSATIKLFLVHGDAKRLRTGAETMSRTNEAAFETIIEAHLLQNGYVRIAPEGFDREHAIFPETVLGFIRETSGGVRCQLVVPSTHARMERFFSYWAARAGRTKA